MGLECTNIGGVHLKRLEPVSDERGSFTRIFSADEFGAAGIEPAVAQTSLSRNTARGTLRGMHLQQSPHGETKLIRCTRGAVFDVAVDTRAGSPTYGEWVGFELNEHDDLALVLGPGIAHGFVTLTDDAEVTYQISVPYNAEAAVGFRWDDPEIGIDWPAEPTVVSKRDRALPALSQMEGWK